MFILNYLVESERGYKKWIFSALLACAEFGVALAAVIVEKGDKTAHATDVQLVGDGSAMALRLDEPSMTEFFEMEGKSGFGNVKLC
jgi:hypothetical protein